MGQFVQQGEVMQKLSESKNIKSMTIIGLE